jgi:uncharacterized protein YkwD
MRKILTTAVLLVALTGAAKAEPTAEEARCFAAINSLREKYKLPPLLMSEELMTKSREWSRTMERQRKLYHGSSYENCAVGHEDGERTFRQWERSSPHRAFLLSRSITEAGVGNSGKYWTFRAKGTEQEQSVSKTTATVAKPKAGKRRGFRRLFHRAFN